MKLNISGNFPSFIGYIKARKNKLEGFEQITQQARQIGVQGIQDNLYPGHGYKHGNLSKSYERCSTVVIPEPFVAEITWTSDVPYQPPQEIKSPHLSVGIHQVWPQIEELAAKFKQL